MTGISRLNTIVAAATALLGSSVADANTPEIFPLSKVKRGQKGYGLSTFEGTTPERWEFEVVGVMKNFRPKMSIILVKSNDPKMQLPGFWRGMSGSPLFIDDRLACAFSYGWSFNKKPIGGCTPIEFMIDEGLNAPVRAQMTAPSKKKRKKGKRAYVVPPAGTEAEWNELVPTGRLGDAIAVAGDARQPWVMRAPLPPTPSVSSKPDPLDPSAMVPAAVPLAISGLSAPAFARAKHLMAPYPVEPMQAGGTGSATEGPNRFALGSPIAVQLARGDASFAATGTVSYLDGERVLAFGHPFFEQGEFYAPVTAAEVHTVIPSAISGFVVASPLRELGSLVQDRLPAIMADTRLRNKMIPMSVFVEAGEGDNFRKGEFHVDVLSNRFLTSPLAGLMASNAIQRFLPDRDHATVRIESKVKIKGYPELSYVDHLYSSDGAMSVIGGARALRVLVPLMFNPYTPIEVERVEIKFKLTFNHNYGEIVELRLPSEELIPGERNYVNVVMERYNANKVIERVPFDVPARLAGSIVKLQVEPGDMAQLDIAPPQSLGDLVAAFRQLLPGTVISATLYTAEDGIAVGGTLVRDMPPSALDRIHAGTRTSRASSYKAILRTTVPATRVVNGRRSILVRVADR